MPNATASIVTPEKHELKSLPGGWVEVRRLTYGQKLQRRTFTGQAVAEQDSRPGHKKAMKMVMDLMNEKSALFDFQHCVVDHNLEDENGEKLNLNDPNDIKRLDPRVGEEIENILDDLNNFEEDDEGN